MARLSWLGWLVPTRRQSPIPVLTGLDGEQLQRCGVALPLGNTFNYRRSLQVCPGSSKVTGESLWTVGALYVTL